MPDPGQFTFTLANGLQVVAERIPSVRAAAFHFLLPAGAVTDPPDLLGANNVLEGLCYRGAGDRDTRALSDALDDLGILRGGGAELEHTSFGAAMLADDLDAALAIYADVILRPRLPDDEFPAERDLALQKLERLKDSPAERLFLALRRSYFTSNHGRTAYGTEEGLRALTPQALRQEHARRYRPGGSILAVAGRFDADQFRETIERLFGRWEGVGPSSPVPEVVTRPQYRHVADDTAQEQIGLAYPYVAPGAPGYYDGLMAIEVLSGGMSGRLFTEVREKRGLCYSVRASQMNVRGMGSVLAYAGTTPERCQETLDVLVHELHRIQEGITDDELARARTGILSSLIMRSEATRSRALFLARDQYVLGRVRGMDEIRAGVEAVTSASVLELVNRFPARDFTTVTLGPVELKVDA